jgi:hypothetical protein
MKLLAIAFQLIVLCAALTLSQPMIQKEGRFSVAGLGDDREVEQFFISFKDAIAKGDKKKVASLVSYPIKVALSSGRRRRIRNPAGFISAYDHIFDAKFKRIITETDVKNLWAKSTGVAMPYGEIWFTGIVRDAKRPEKYTIKIITINGAIAN